MTLLPASPLSKQMEESGASPCAYKRGSNLTSRDILHGAARCSYPERLMGRLVYLIIGAERCIVARSQKTRGLLESIVAKLCITVCKGHVRMTSAWSSIAYAHETSS